MGSFPFTECLYSFLHLFPTTENLLSTASILGMFFFYLYTPDVILQLFFLPRNLSLFCHLPVTLTAIFIIDHFIKYKTLVANHIEIQIKLCRIL